MPAANQTPPVLRINNTGLAQLAGAGFRTSSMRKSPFGSSGTWGQDQGMGQGPRSFDRVGGAHCQRRPTASVGQTRGLKGALNIPLCGTRASWR